VTRFFSHCEGLRRNPVAVPEGRHGSFCKDPRDGFQPDSYGKRKGDPRNDSFFVVARSRQSLPRGDLVFHPKEKDEARKDEEIRGKRKIVLPYGTTRFSMTPWFVITKRHIFASVVV